MRALILAGLLAAFSPAVAIADESISGQWRTDLNHGVLINMDVLADGHWVSQTIQDDKVVAEMAGTYQQTATDDSNGKIVPDYALSSAKPWDCKTSGNQCVGAFRRLFALSVASIPARVSTDSHLPRACTTCSKREFTGAWQGTRG